MNKAKKIEDVEEVENIESSDSQLEDICLQQEAALVVERHAVTAMGAGLVPIPLVDLIAITGIQVNMISRLSKLYGVEFSKNKSKTIISALIGGSIPAFAAMPVASLFQAIPVIGWGLGASSMSILAGSSTYAVGRVFTRHFATGGDISNLDVNASTDYMKEQYQKGKKQAGDFIKK